MTAPADRPQFKVEGVADIKHLNIRKEGPEDEDYATCADMERKAALDPDHDWRISYYAPLYEAVYQRHGPEHWVLIEALGGEVV